MRSLATFVASGLFAATLAASTTGHAQILSEVVVSHAGADTQEFVEIHGVPETSYADRWVVVLEGDGADNPGSVDAVLQVGTTDVAGLWHSGFLAQDSLEDGTSSLLLVTGFSGAVGNDLDLDDDGVLDALPWGALLDSLAFFHGAAGDRAYAPAVLGSGFDGVALVPGGASRFPFGIDSDAASDWKRGNPDNLAYLQGILGPGEAWVTPGAVNLVTIEDYFAGVDTASQTTLRSSLHEAVDDHIRYPYAAASATDTWVILEAADEDLVDPTRVLDVYKNVSFAKHGGSGDNPNREHSWPQSYGFPDEAIDNSPRTDCHHLFPSDEMYNNNRANHPYDTCNAACIERPTVSTHGMGGGSGVYPGNSNWYDNASRTWGTWIGRRGDVARAILYMDVRYEGGTHGFTGFVEPDLRLTDDKGLIQTTGVNALVAYMGMLTVLVQWHEEDPPDAKERARNAAIYRYQGNRNPFVDHPEWVACTFEGACSECGDGVTEPEEECDDAGESPTCDSNCTDAECGDGTFNASAGETCDDGLATPTCDVDCTLVECGDDTLNPAAGEACDDGNTMDGDGCSARCLDEGQGGAGGGGRGGEGPGGGGSSSSAGGGASGGSGGSATAASGAGGDAAGPTSGQGGAGAGAGGAPDPGGDCGCSLPGIPRRGASLAAMLLLTLGWRRRSRLSSPLTATCSSCRARPRA
jgi:cysteine-rich repeat protein